ncbi:hypothetical protein TanjilG_28120 [Lupinus angustifolius]|uniref:Uncharacterized protein n=1 Tax=Lupinus angustifolius TaxID=3871 RepID=A0A4P1RGR0_LUPAN|nr:hypothetical protein TanjilG_28120 [Lupinus angustifolius]
MGVHMVVMAIAKLHWQLSSHTLSATAATFAYSVLLKLLMSSFKLFRNEALYRSNLFLFRISQIVFNRELTLSTRARLERAIRLIWISFSTSTARTSEGLEIVHNTFHDLSIIAL